MSAPTDRPPLSPEEVRAELLSRISEGRSMRKICGADGKPGDSDMPGRRTVFDWLAKDPEFARAYSLAMASRADAHAEEILDISDRDDLDHNEKRVRIDARKWLTAKMRPEKYAERYDVKHSGSIGGDLTPEERKARIAALEAELTAEALKDKDGPDGEQGS